MQRRRIYLTGGICLLLVWSVTALGLWVADRMTPRAEGVRELLRSTRLADLEATARSSFVRQVATQLSELQPDERRQAQLSAEMQAFYGQMAAPERLQYLEWTRPPGTGMMARAFDAMRPQRQRRHLGVALSDLQAVEPRYGEPRTATAIMAEIQRRGVAATVDGDVTRRDLELQPVVEQTQRVLQMAR